MNQIRLHGRIVKSKEGLNEGVLNSHNISIMKPRTPFIGGARGCLFVGLFEENPFTYRLIVLSCSKTVPCQLGYLNPMLISSMEMSLSTCQQ